jgi:phosphoribosylaminoimidazolecarboxamide formyltransferase/IMP cyclohydrolase
LANPRALLSVTDKTGIAPFARGLREVGYEVLSTGGTARLLRGEGIPVVDVAAVTGAPEILDGRVKTLHPAIHGAILGRGTPSHQRQMAENGIEPIDLVCVNLYRFEEAAAGERDWEGLIEEIDVGGPAMVRAAAKNHERVVVVTDPGQYDDVLAELRAGGTTAATRRLLALEAFQRTAAYDALIAMTLAGRIQGAPRFPAHVTRTWLKGADLRYGENPHQSAALYRDPAAGRQQLAWADVLGGKMMSFNNYLDADAAIELVREFERPAVAIIKHANPCGCAVSDELADAFEGALAGDPVSAFGGIVACNRSVDAETARRIGATFFEVVAAPGFTPDALVLLSTKKNLRLAAVGTMSRLAASLEIRPIRGGMLVQERDEVLLPDRPPRVVTRQHPSAEQWDDLRFAWAVCKHVRSNAIVLAKGGRVVGVGAGQMSRVDSVRLAVAKAGPRARGAVLASDAFFPFPDGVQAALEAGIEALLQPGGSVRDPDVIAAADAGGAAMAFTDLRHFRH